MSNILFSADCHFNHIDIIKLANRPFKDVKSMNVKIIKNINEMCKPNDVLYHLGDFKFLKSKQSDVVNKFPEQEISCQIVHIAGNHDGNNGVRGLSSGVLEIGGYTFLLIHKPPVSPLSVDKNIDCILCGHVHNNWKVKSFCGVEKTIPMINVGVDVMEFRPVKLKKILKMIVNYNKTF